MKLKLIERVYQLMQDGEPRTYHEIAEKAHIQARTVSRLMLELMKEDRLILVRKGKPFYPAIYRAIKLPEIPSGIAALPSRLINFDKLPPRDPHGGWIKELGRNYSPLGTI